MIYFRTLSLILREKKIINCWSQYTQTQNAKKKFQLVPVTLDTGCKDGLGYLNPFKSPSAFLFIYLDDVFFFFQYFESAIEMQLSEKFP